MIKVKVAGQEVHALIDTGSDFSLVGESFLNRFPSFVDGIKPCSQYVSTVSANTFKLIGKVHIPIEITDSKFAVNAYVSPRTPWELLLGIDFLRKYEMKIDFQNEIVHIPTHLNVFSTGHVLIPPFTEKIVKCVLSKSVSADISGTITGISGLKSRGLLCTNAYVKINKGSSHIPVRLANITGEKQMLHPNTRIAHFHLAESKETLENISHSQTERNTSKDIQTSTTPSINSLTENQLNSEQLELLLGNSPLNSEEKQKLTDLIQQYADVFHKEGEPLGCTSVLKHSIKLVPNAQPFRSMPYRMNPVQREEVSRQLRDMLDQGICSESDSPFSSPVLLVKKSDGSQRFVVDMRKLNSITVKDSFPLIRIDDALDSLGGSKYFATLDLFSGYWQCELDEESKPLTGFTTFEGLFHFNRMAFGLCNAPSTFARLMSRVLKGGILWKKCLVYLDDVIIFAPAFEEYLKRIAEVLQRLRESNLKLKTKKCKFGQTRVKFLGHIVTPEGIITDPDKRKAIQNFPQPKRLKALRSFLGLTNYYARFVHRYREIARPLYRLTRKHIPFIWTQDCQEAFEKLKNVLQSPPVLAYPDFSKQFILETDCSNFAMGFVLSQEYDDRKHVIQYGGRNLSNAEQKYSTTEREALAVFQGVHHYKSYLQGNKFVLRTDHLPLTYVFKKGYGNDRISRWALYLSKYQFDICYKKGSSLEGPDALSRQVYTDENTLDIEQLPKDDDELFPPHTSNRNPTDPSKETPSIASARTLPMVQKHPSKSKTSIHEKARLRVLGERLKNPTTRRSGDLVQLPEP